MTYATGVSGFGPASAIPNARSVGCGGDLNLPASRLPLPPPPPPPPPPPLAGRDPRLARVPPTARVLYAEAAMGGAPRLPCVGMKPARTSSSLSTLAYAV